jgi:hypothetical protein
MDAFDKPDEWPALPSLVDDELWKSNYGQDFSYLLDQQLPADDIQYVKHEHPVMSWSIDKWSKDS